jgi:hypothetical protein
VQLVLSMLQAPARVGQLPSTVQVAPEPVHVPGTVAHSPLLWQVVFAAEQVPAPAQSALTAQAP